MEPLVNTCDAFTQYDQKATAYRNWRNTAPTPLYIEKPSIAKLLGENLSERAILDVACGDGYMTRFIKNLGAAKLVGVDISARLIKLAREQETAEQKGIVYHCSDVQHMPVYGEFNIATAIFLLNYAPTMDVMQEYCKSIAANVTQNGLIIGIVPNGTPNAQYGSRAHKKYGFLHDDKPRTEDGQRSYFEIFDIHSQENIGQFEFYNWFYDSYKSALEHAGFGNIEWIVPHVGAEGLAKYGEQYWKEFYDPEAPIMLFRGRKL